MLFKTVNPDAKVHLEIGSAHTIPSIALRIEDVEKTKIRPPLQFRKGIGFRCFGGAWGIRTPDLNIANVARYQLC